MALQSASPGAIVTAYTNPPNLTANGDSSWLKETFNTIFGESLVNADYIIPT